MTWHFQSSLDLLQQQVENDRELLFKLQEQGGRYRSQFTCLDIALKPVNGPLIANHDGLLFYFVEGRCGSLPCPPYDNTKELSCAVCTK